MKTAMRVAIGLVGLFNLMIGLRFLFTPANMANEFALSPLGIPGMATMRADFPAFFLTGAAFALIGAWRADAKALLVPLMLLGIAIFGRFVSLALDGTAPTTFLPMIAEAVMIGLLLIGYRSLSQST
jgi:hypothetical protein